MSRDDMPNLVEIPRITLRDDVQYQFHWEFYDYPRTGALLWQGNRYWFNEIELGEPAIAYRLIDLSTDKWLWVDEVQNLFRQCVGTHNDYDPVTQKCGLDDLRPKNYWSEFYDSPIASKSVELVGPIVAILVLPLSADD